MKAEIKKHRGIPTLFLDGKPDPALLFWSNWKVGKHFADFARAGVKIFTFSPVYKYHHGESDNMDLSDAWIGPERLDYERVDQGIKLRLEWLLETNSNPLFLLRITVSPPAWWSKEYPEEVLRRSDGSVDMVLHEGSACKGPTYPSYASERWRNDAGMALRNFIEHVQSSSYADNVIGYHLAAGNCGEWFYMGSHEGYIHDYSEPQTRAFRKWLKEKYATVSELREAWKMGDVDFETATIPSPAKRTNPTCLHFLDPAKSQDVIDYNIFHSYMVADAIAHFCGVVKEATRGKKLAGAFYGYILRDPFGTAEPDGFAWYVSPMTIGHLGLERALSSPHVDFLCAPSRYTARARAIGTGYGHFPALTESVKIHGKLWFDEDDYRTHLTPFISEEASARGGRTSNLQETISIQRREFANVLCHGAGMWWMNMEGATWFDDPDIMRDIKKMVQIGKKRLHFDCRSAAEIAVIIHTDSMCGHIIENTFFDIKPQLGHMGAPFDFLRLEDLAIARPYKLYIFLNPYYLDKEKRELIEEVIHQKGKTALWSYAAGFARDTLSDENCCDLTKIKVVSQNKEEARAIEIVDFDHPITRGIEEGFVFQEEYPLGPVFYADDPEARVLGVIGENKLAGLVVKEKEEIKTVYCATRFLPARLLRNIGRWAGVHIYIEEEEGIYTNKSFFSLHTNLSGEKTIRFPRKTDVYDVFEEKQIAEGVDELMLNLPEKHTVLYFLGSKEEWETAGKKQWV